jgi:hypothetical protein
MTAKREKYPIIESSRFGYDHVVTALVIGKADVRAKNDEGKTRIAR